MGVGVGEGGACPVPVAVGVPGEDGTGTSSKGPVWIVMSIAPKSSIIPRGGGRSTMASRSYWKGGG